MGDDLQVERALAGVADGADDEAIGGLEDVFVSHVFLSNDGRPGSASHLVT
jgi:hypothetical protein